MFIKSVSCPKKPKEDSYKENHAWGFCQKSCRNHPRRTKFAARHTPLEISGLKVVPSETCKKFMNDGLNFDPEFDLCVAKDINSVISVPTFKVSLR